MSMIMYCSCIYLPQYQLLYCQTPLIIDNPSLLLNFFLKQRLICHIVLNHVLAYWHFTRHIHIYCTLGSSRFSTLMAVSSKKLLAFFFLSSKCITWCWGCDIAFKGRQPWPIQSHDCNNIYIYIYIYSHPQTDCFVLSELFSVARHAGRSKPGSKPVQRYVRLCFRPLVHQADHVG